MKLHSVLSIGAAVCLTLSSTFAAGPNTYQVTGPILALTDTMITVQKGTERWEIARDASNKVTGDLKVGAKVTVTYTMTATAIAAKMEKPVKAGSATMAPTTKP